MATHPVPKLRWLYVYLTRACNCKCAHCWLSAEPADLDMNVSISDILDLSNRALPLGLEFVRLTGGEPLLAPGIDKLLLEMNSLGIRTEIETNGMEMTPHLANVIADCNTFVGISLDGESDYHDYMRGKSGGYDKVLRAIRYLQEREVPMLLVMALRRQNVDHIPHVMRVAREHGIDTVKINPILPTGRAEDLDDLLTAAELLQLNKKYLSKTEPRVDFDLPPSYWPLSAIDRTPACRFKNTLSVLSTGQLAMCGLGFDRDDWCLSPIDTDLDALWHNHPLLLDLRENIPAGLTGICARCLTKDMCNGGCRAFALLQSGSWTSSFFRCEELYDAGLFPESRLLPDPVQQ